MEMKTGSPFSRVWRPAPAAGASETNVECQDQVILCTIRGLYSQWWASGAIYKLNMNEKFCAQLHRCCEAQARVMQGKARKGKDS